MAGQIDPQGFVPVVERKIFRPARRTGDADIVDKHVEPAGVPVHPVEDFENGGLVSSISGDGDDAVAIGFQGFDGCCVDIGGEHVRAASGKPPCGHISQSAARSIHEHAQSFQIVAIHRSPSLWPLL